MKRTVRFPLLSAALLLSFAAAQPLIGYAAEPTTSILWSYPPDDGAYAAGTHAMDEQRWADAIRQFDQVIAAKSTRTDAALYWKAYSLRKMGRRPEATATCDLLRAQYSVSSWNKDCASLGIDARVNVHIDDLVARPFPPASGASPDTHITRGSDEDLKVLALNSLLHQDPSHALPVLRGILSGNQPMSLKKHAIFVLAQSKSPEAASILHDAVTGKLDPGLQREAIQMMGVFQGQRANDTLAGVYRSTTDIQVKRSVISAFFISHDAPRLVELAHNEKDIELKRSIVSQLALMNDKAATDYMLELLK